LIERSFAIQATVTDYAAQLGISAPHLNRIAKRILGETPNALITKRRMIEAERLLTFTRHSIALVALRSGYQDAPYFNRAFKKKHATASCSSRS
jgi:AraC family transcriptional activator of pobA